MNPLDMRTIVFCYTMTTIVCLWLIVLLWWHNRDRFAGTAFWVVDFVFQTAALFLIIMRETIPDWISMVLSNTMVIVGSILGILGLERFMRKKGPQIQNYLIVILFIFFQSYFALVRPSLALRDLNIAVALLLIGLQYVWLMWHRVEPSQRSLTFGVGMVMAFYCMLSSARIARFFISPDLDSNYLQPTSFFAGLVLISYQVLFLLLTYSLVLMVNKFLIMESSAEIVERKLVEEALRASEQYAHNVINSSLDMIIATDHERRIVEFNRAATKVFGYKREEVIGKNVDMLYAVPDEGALISQTMLKEGVYAGEVTNKRKNGDQFTSYVSAAPLRDREDNVLGSVGVSRDITEEILLAEERSRLLERLNRSEKMESLGTLAGGVAHDLNNVLGIIVGYAEMVLEDTDKSSHNWKSLEHIMNGGLKAAAIVEDLLTLARRGVPGRAILNINTIVTDCQTSPEFIKLSSHHPSVNIITDLEPDLLNISGSSVHLGKSLYNLISNASEAMPKGGTVTITTTNQYLDKPIQGYDQIHTGDYVVFSVSDTGEGISGRDLKRIFEPFYTKKIMGRSGTGLGLAVVWGTIKDHNGYINVQSEEGKGSTFTLYFPVTREEVTIEAASIPAEEYVGKGESILIVDDVKEQRDLAASLLTNLNYNVAKASSGEEAMKYLKEHKVDLIVLDMIMDPGMDGLDTYKQVIASSPKQKAIIVSGFSESDRVKEARRLGVGSYLRKPYIKERLGVAVRKELERG